MAALGMLLGAAGAYAQCSNGRYISYLFPHSISTVTYSTVYSQQMDIYQPVGDVATSRPLIILAHGGSFFGGNRVADLTVDSLCARFARRGYVTASIDYRLSTLPNMVNPDSTYAIDEVMKAISDGKAAIRYFVKDAATTNTYKIDTNNIFIGGNSAGAVLYMHVGYATDSTEYPDYIDTAMVHNGGFEGNSGNAGYTTKSKAVINLAGALNMVSFVNTGDMPSVNVQGDADNTVPYNCAYPLSGGVRVKLCGLGALEPEYAAKGISHMSKVYPGAGHVPWSTDAVMFNSVDSLVRVFLYSLVCPGVNAVHSLHAATEVALFPNPATGLVNIASAVPVSELSVSDQTGRTVYTVSGINKERLELNTSRYAPGIYFIRLTFADDSNTPVVKRIIVQ